MRAVLDGKVADERDRRDVATRKDAASGPMSRRRECVPGRKRRAYYGRGTWPGFERERNDSDETAAAPSPPPTGEGRSRDAGVEEGFAPAATFGARGEGSRLEEEAGRHDGRRSVGKTVPHPHPPDASAATAHHGIDGGRPTAGDGRSAVSMREQCRRGGGGGRSSPGTIWKQDSARTGRSVAARAWCGSARGEARVRGCERRQDSTCERI